MAKTFEQERKEYFAEMGRRLRKQKLSKAKSASVSGIKNAAKKASKKNTKK